MPVCTWQASEEVLSHVHLSGVNARNPFGRPISSSQLISRRVATARLWCVLYLCALAVLLVQVCEVGDGRRMLSGGIGR
jgi:hypothetical protein